MRGSCAFIPPGAAVTFRMATLTACGLSSRSARGATRKHILSLEMVATRLPRRDGRSRADGGCAYVQAVLEHRALERDCILSLEIKWFRSKVCTICHTRYRLVVVFNLAEWPTLAVGPASMLSSSARQGPSRRALRRWMRGGLGGAHTRTHTVCAGALLDVGGAGRRAHWYRVSAR